jgi:hypothetical protein
MTSQELTFRASSMDSQKFCVEVSDRGTHPQTNKKLEEVDAINVRVDDELDHCTDTGILCNQVTSNTQRSHLQTQMIAYGLEDVKQLINKQNILELEAVLCP